MRSLVLERDCTTLQALNMHSYTDPRILSVSWSHLDVQLYVLESAKCISLSHCPMKIKIVKVNVLSTHTQIMLLTSPLLVVVASINERKTTLKPNLYLNRPIPFLFHRRRVKMRDLWLWR